jgi:hypothetical protein
VSEAANDVLDELRLLESLLESLNFDTDYLIEKLDQHLDEPDHVIRHLVSAKQAYLDTATALLAAASR